MKQPLRFFSRFSAFYSSRKFKTSSRLLLSSGQVLGTFWTASLTQSTRDIPFFAGFHRDAPGYAHLCMLKIASKCYNRARKHWHSRMEASFFIRGGGRRSAAPFPGPALAWLPSTDAGRCRLRRGSVVGAGTIVPRSWRSLVMFRRRRFYRLRSLGEPPFLG